MIANDNSTLWGDPPSTFSIAKGELKKPKPAESQQAEASLGRNLAEIFYLRYEKVPFTLSMLLPFTYLCHR